MNTSLPYPSSTEALVSCAPFLGQGSCIGVFDSGLGGLSIMQALQRQLPQAFLTYVADSGHAPYGERDEKFIIERSSLIVDFLLQQGAKVIVVACNTATAAAIHALRLQWPHLPIIGIEPGIKPAIRLSSNKRIGVLATPATLSSQKFRDLINQYVIDVELVLQPCPGLAKEIEHGQLDTPKLRALVSQFCDPLSKANVDTVVMGCTHYPLIRSLIQDALSPNVQLVDTADAVALQTAKCAHQVAVEIDKEKITTHSMRSGQVALFSSGSTLHLSQTVEKWLGLNLPTQSLSALALGK